MLAPHTSRKPRAPLCHTYDACRVQHRMKTKAPLGLIESWNSRQTARRQSLPGVETVWTGKHEHLGGLLVGWKGVLNENFLPIETNYAITFAVRRSLISLRTRFQLLMKLPRNKHTGPKSSNSSMAKPSSSVPPSKINQFFHQFVDDLLWNRIEQAVDHRRVLL